MKETKMRMQILKGSDGQLKSACGPLCGWPGGPLHQWELSQDLGSVHLSAEPVHRGRKEAGRLHWGAGLAEPGWRSSGEKLERQMEGQVGAVPAKRPNKDV